MNVKVESHPKFPGVYRAIIDEGTRLATENLVPGRIVYGEKLVKYKEKEYRLWDPYRSKLAATILKGAKGIPVMPNSKVLYLGAASGTTASHVSDIVGENGHVYCVEFAPRTMRELIENVCIYRKNMSPILEDARLPERYLPMLEKVDVIYCDIAQPEQAKVVADNATLYLKNGGWIMLAIKARSIDVTKEPSEIYKREMKLLEESGFEIHEILHLEPYDRAHAMVIASYNKMT